jgi:hypothetical protein
MRSPAAPGRGTSRCEIRASGDTGAGARPRRWPWPPRPACTSGRKVVMNFSVAALRAAADSTSVSTLAMEDSLKGRVTRTTRAALRLIMPAMTASPGRGVQGGRFTGKGRRIQACVAGEHLAVQGTFSPGRTRMVSPTCTCSGRTASRPVAVWRVARVRSGRQQRADGAAGTGHGQVLQQLTGFKKDHHRHGFGHGIDGKWPRRWRSPSGRFHRKSRPGARFAAHPGKHWPGQQIGCQGRYQVQARHTPCAQPSANSQ